MTTITPTPSMRKARLPSSSQASNPARGGASAGGRADERLTVLAWGASGRGPKGAVILDHVPEFRASSHSVAGARSGRTAGLPWSMPRFGPSRLRARRSAARRSSSAIAVLAMERRTDGIRPQPPAPARRRVGVGSLSGQGHNRGYPLRPPCTLGADLDGGIGPCSRKARGGRDSGVGRAVCGIRRYPVERWDLPGTNRCR